MVLDLTEETPITYTDDTQTGTWNIPSRVTQDDLVWYMNRYFEDTEAVGVKWISEVDGYYIHADHVFSLNGNLETIIPVSSFLSHIWRIHYNNGAFHANYGLMVGDYPVDITNGL